MLLIGASGSGKSAFAAKHFLPTEVVSSDACRAMVADDPDDQAASDDAFALLEFIVATRLRAGRLTVIDATNARRQDRARLIALGREHHALLAAIVLDMPASLVPGAQPLAHGPAARRPGHPPARPRGAPLPARPAGGGLPDPPPPHLPGGG